MGGKYFAKQKPKSEDNGKGEKKLPKSVKAGRKEAVTRGKKRRLMSLYSEY